MREKENATSVAIRAGVILRQLSPKILPDRPRSCQIVPDPVKDRSCQTVLAPSWRRLSVQGWNPALSVVLVVFYLQNQWLGKKSYISISGKGDSGVHPELPKKTKWVIYSTVLPWAFMTFIIYLMIMFGGFVEMWGVDHSFTLKHYIEAFSHPLEDKPCVI